MGVTERVGQRRKTRLTILLVCAVSACGVLGESGLGTAGPPVGEKLQAERVPLTLVGYVSPSEAAPRWLGWAGAWSATRGWITPPDDPEKRLPDAWTATSWQLFSDPEAPGRTIHTQPVPEWEERGSFYRLAAPAPAGVAVTGVMRPRPRLARAEQPDRRELRASTRKLLAQYGIPVPARPRIREAYRVDLDGDGREEVLWTARSRDGWVSPIPNTPGGPRPGDYALLGLRFLTPHGVRCVALALAAAGDDCFRYRLFSPVDLNGDGRMEILAHAQGFEDDSLLVFTFDGRRVVGVLGTHLPDDQPTGCGERSGRGASVVPSVVFVRPREWLEGEGDLGVVSGAGQRERRIPTPGTVSGLAVDGRRLACIGGKGDLLVRTASGWQSKRPMAGDHFCGTPCCQSGTHRLFVGGCRETGDGGLWLVDTQRPRPRRVLRALDADIPLNDVVRVSPGGTRVASGGRAVVGGFTLRVLDLKSRRGIRQPGERGLINVMDFVWIDEGNLLLTCSPGEDEDGHKAYPGGVWRLNLKTRRTHHWLYPAAADVMQIRRSPQGDRFAVALDGVDPTAALGVMGKRIVLVDRRTKTQWRLATAGPSKICGFSPDGSRLLLVTLRDEAGKAKGDAYVIDLKNGRSRLIARDVTEAAWMEEPQGGAAGPPHPASTAAGRAVPVRPLMRVSGRGMRATVTFAPAVLRAVQRYFPGYRIAR